MIIKSIFSQEVIKMENKSNLKKILKSKKGSEIVTTPIIIGLGIILISILIVFSIKILTPYIWYEKLSSTCLKYIFVMEEYGYLTNIEKEHLIEDLINQGFDEKELKVNCTNKRQSYGSPIYLNVNYNYNMELPFIGNKEIQMNISRESVSKI